ncbi:MAG: FAD-dependent oxidoreductase [Proteobacteria bacterium]|nr:FAD-dependent oxidoreductase [Pseudomonadota bacterium]
MRCNASRVTILYRRTLEEMPADRDEIEDALAEGITIEFLVAPVEVLEKNGRVKALRCRKMELGEPDDSERRRPVPVEGSDYDIVCNHIVAAIGQDCDLIGTTGNALGDVEASRWNTIVADEATCSTNIEGVFAGGDVATGPAAAVDAIGAGRKAALAIDRYLETGTNRSTPHGFPSRKSNLGEIPSTHYDGIETVGRSEMRQLEADIRINSFEEVDKGIDPSKVRVEASRCLACGCAETAECKLKEYADEYGADQKRLKGKVRKFKVDDRHPFILLDPNKCILCGKCVRVCDEWLGVSAYLPVPNSSPIPFGRFSRVSEVYKGHRFADCCCSRKCRIKGSGNRRIWIRFKALAEAVCIRYTVSRRNDFDAFEAMPRAVLRGSSLASRAKILLMPPLIQSGWPAMTASKAWVATASASIHM